MLEHQVDRRNRIRPNLQRGKQCAAIEGVRSDVLSKETTSMNMFTDLKTCLLLFLS